MASASKPLSGTYGHEAGAAGPSLHGSLFPTATNPAIANGKQFEVRASVDSDPEMLMPHGNLYLAAKDGFDRVLALTMLLLTWPLILIAMVLVKATSRGPALYSQTRVGRHGKLFTIYKLRSMVVESESFMGASWSTPGDRRVTRFGHWLRRTHIDELPQLWNVLMGDMSLVGPRPERPEFVPMLEQTIDDYRYRLVVRPGITGFAQVQLPPDTDIASVRLKLAYDLHYVRAVGFWFDFRISGATTLKMAGGSFSLVRRLFRFPARATIEARYEQLAHDAQRRKAARVSGVSLGVALPAGDECRA